MSEVELAALLGLVAGAVLGWMAAKSDWRGAFGYSSRQMRRRYPHLYRDRSRHD